MSKVNGICDAVVAALLAAGVAAGRVTRSLEEASSYQEFPAVLVHLVADVESPDRPPIGFEYRSLTLELEVLAEGDVPHAACDVTHREANTVLLGLPYAIQRGAVQWGYDDENPALGICRAQYLVSYRCPKGEL